MDVSGTVNKGSVVLDIVDEIIDGQVMQGL